MIQNGWLYASTKIYVARSKVHGLRVFANEDIKKGEVFEITPIIDLVLNPEEDYKSLYDYRFAYNPDGKATTKLVVALGYGSLYNHSDTPNAKWKLNVNLNMFEFFSTKEIKKNEEIFIYYGNKDYWDARPNTSYKK